MITDWQKSLEMKNQTSPGFLDGFQSVGVKVRHQHHRRTGTLDKIHDPIRE